ncbi:DUF192 domain-containing protein [Alteromonas sp. H39]|uniref:DUF192 domain-containing protein n=1 Tax=Alteromonas sp. H39 TaxID=3389876 RepID=UPI0039E0D81E
MPMIKPATLAFIALFLLTAAAVQAIPDLPVKFDSASIEVKGQEYPVEYAQTYEQRARGLMYRKSLCEDCGMLFRFSTPKKASMWMKNTFIPLDVAFIDRNGVITDIKALQPHNLESVGASEEVIYALEMNQGWFARQNIKVGDQIIVNP